MGENGNEGRSDCSAYGERTPKLYGGTERIVSYLTEELVKLDHDVTLFASGDSVTSAKSVSCVPNALRLDPKICDVIPYYMLMLDRVRRQSHLTSRWDPAQNSCENRSGGRTIFSRTNRAVVGSTGHRIHRRNQRASESEIPGAGCWSAVSD
jgi:hypothetical protein